MICEPFSEQIPLYTYGELGAEQEEQFEAHLESCASCRTELDALRALGRALSRREIEPPAPLLAECRRDLLLAVEQSADPGRRWTPFGRSFQAFMNPILGLRQLGFAAALIALGFVAARFTIKSNMLPGSASQTSSTVAGFSPDSVVSGIRSVQPDPTTGQIRVDLDETHSKVITGSADSAMIQELLLRAVRDQANPGLRVESIEILKNHSGSAGVRRALLQALARDPNPGVRLKALEGLKAFSSSDEEVRKALTQALLSDKNPAVRIQAIDLLTKDRDEALVGVLQALVQTEDNNYVRIQCQNALRRMNASEGAF
jgi:plasmid stability protein